MQEAQGTGTFHSAADIGVVSAVAVPAEGAASIPFVEEFSYEFTNFYHPFVADLIKRLNQTSVAGMLDPDFLAGLGGQPYPASEYAPVSGGAAVTIDPPAIDIAPGDPYSNYNWELLYHIPVMVAVHLSGSQRFAEAQRWFHLVFDPTSTDPSVPAPRRFWKCFALREQGPAESVAALIALLSDTDPAQAAARAAVIAGYNAIAASPFDPHAVARTRPSAYQWYVVMKYLDNLIAWGDSLFLADTQETINEATLCYVLAANILGPRPQQLPQPGGTSPMSFRQLRQAGLDRLSDALVDLESQFPFNLVPGGGQGGSGGSGGASGQAEASGALFGIGRSLYFCVPPNPALLAYWDTVADRLFKIRNSENISGVPQQLPLFDPPIDPGMLVQAAAAGIDIGSIVSGLNAPASPVRSLPLIARALELAAEVRSLGSSLLAALEKGDAEQLALKRQDHEVKLQQKVQDTRYLQWQHARELTTSLLRTRQTVLERYSYYLSLLDLAPDTATVPPTFDPDRRELTEANFSDAYDALVAKYDLTVATPHYNQVQFAQGGSPSTQAGATGQGQLYLSKTEDSELNTHLPAARDLHLVANVANAIAAAVFPIPSAEAHLAFWGLGAHSKIFEGATLAGIAKIAGDIAEVVAGWEQDQAGIASRTGGYERRVNEWTLQANLAARELMQIGRQIIASLIAEQIAEHDYDTAKTQVQQATEIQDFLKSKVTSAAFYSWMRSDVAGLYYQYYRLACDTARKAEQTMKRELMRPELDATSFVQYNYWDTGHQGLLSGEALYLDVKRMELAYHDNNKRELELTRHVSLRQLDPLALLSLRITGSCTVTVPEWLYDRDCPGHYLRRIKSVSLSVPCVTGPYTPVSCTVTLQSSSVRTSPDLAGGAYARSATSQDDRFTDYYGCTDVIVTSTGTSDSGMFETSLRDERFLPFEGAGAISTWTLALPAELPAFDYTTISDVIMHIRYTARVAGDPLGTQATRELVAMLDTAGQSGQALLLCLRYDFPTQWSAFVNGAGCTLTLDRQFFPYAAASAPRITADSLALYAASGGSIASVSPLGAAGLAAVSAGLNGPGGTAQLTLPADPAVMVADPGQLVFLVLGYHFGQH